MRIDLKTSAIRVASFAWYSGQVQAYFVWLGIPVIFGMILRACLGGHPT